MKRRTILTITALMVSGATLFAQSMSDGLLFSENNYSGTARTMAMGNAFTALGGDLGSVGINPAGSAVASYSQLVITPGLNVSNSFSSAFTGSSYGFGDRRSSTDCGAALPNVGVTIAFDTHRNTGLKRFTFGFITNETQNYFESSIASGVNNATTLCGSFASGATGLLYDDITGQGAYEGNWVNDWGYVLANNAGAISCLSDSKLDYVGATQGCNAIEGGYEYYNLGSLDQVFGRERRGAKRDMVLNFGFDFSDIVYFGFNLGVTELRYKYDQYLRETPADGEQENFAITFDGGKPTYFDSMRHNYYYDADGAGIYAKAGIIVTPNNWLRIGAAVQTPTGIQIDEYWGQSAETSFRNSIYNASDKTPESENSYTLRTPFLANVGVAANFLSCLLVSADYEITDYKTMKFKAPRRIDDEVFDEVNADIKNYMGVSHNLRAGIEYKPFNMLAVRAGYNFLTCPEKETDVFSASPRYIKAYTHSASFGLGFNSNGMFFADAAVRYMKQTTEYVTPYQYYMLDEEGNVLVNEDVPVPTIEFGRNLWTVALTLGLRF
ncbi:MAG: hypothetical protein MJY56_06585 [Bacteroidales bacterium]|nr:hypothetical protein [Bacteroidales bacterium]